MSKTSYKAFGMLGLLIAFGLAAGCDLETADKSRPAKTAAEALSVEGDGDRDRFVEERRNVEVVEETTVIDRETGEVIASEREVTPVTVTKEKEIETEVEVDTGETRRTRR